MAHWFLTTFPEGWSNTNKGKVTRTRLKQCPRIDNSLLSKYSILLSNGGSKLQIAESDKKIYSATLGGSSKGSLCKKSRRAREIGARQGNNFFEQLYDGKRTRIASTRVQTNPGSRRYAEVS